MRKKCELLGARARCGGDVVTCRYTCGQLSSGPTTKPGPTNLSVLASFFQAAEAEGSLQSDETDSVLAARAGSDAVRSARRIDEVAWETVQAVKGDRLVFLCAHVVVVFRAIVAEFGSAE